MLNAFRNYLQVNSGTESELLQRPSQLCCVVDRQNFLPMDAALQGWREDFPDGSENFPDRGAIEPKKGYLPEHKNTFFQ